MKELQEILKKISQLEKDEKAILATVVDVQGSGYRRPSARMLIDENGYSIGTVSGGCLESDVLERAKKILQTGEAQIISYDTIKDEDSVFGLGMGCRGIVRILLEKVSHEDRFFDYLRKVFVEREILISATLISANSDAQKICSRLLYYDSKVIFSDFESEISDLLLNKINGDAFNKKSFVEQFEFGEILFETFNPPLNFLLFGAGFDALPLIKFAKESGWRVTAIDHRSAFANAERLPEADEIIVSNSEDSDEKFFADENSVAVVMTHNYERDKEILRRLMNSKCKYIGALGPKKRTEKLLEEIGENYANEQLTRLYAPVGLDIGADSPEAIALSIVAEIQAVLKNRNGGFLRDREGSIYDR